MITLWTTQLIRAVREVMDVDADPTFDARVVDLIRRPARAVRWPRLALVGALGMALAVSVVWIRTPGPDRTEPQVQSVQREPTGVRLVDPAPHLPARWDTGTTAATPPSRASSGRTRSRPPAARSELTSAAEGLSSAAIVTGPPLGIEALPSIEPIEVAPVQTRAITTEHIVIVPLPPIPDVYIETLLQPEG